MRFLGGLLILLWGATAAADGFTSAVRVETLRNGLSVLLAPDSLAPTVQVGVWYDTGLPAEKDGKSGLTYVVVRLVAADRGERAADLRRRLVAAGGTTGFSIDPDFAGTTEAVPPEALDLALQLEAVRMSPLRVTDSDLRGEIEAVRQEHAARLAQSPIGPAMERLSAGAYAGHPYARPVVGLDEDVQGLTRADVEPYARERFTPGRATLSLVGKFDPDAALDLIRRRLGGLPAGPAASKERPVPMPKQRGARRDSLRAGIPVSVLLAGWRGPGSADPDSPALEVLARLLTGGDGGALARALARPGGPIVRIQGDLDRRREASLLFVAAVVPNAAAADTAEQRLIEAVEKRAREPVPEADLERAKHQVELAQLFSAETVLGRTQALTGARMSSGDWKEWEGRLASVRRLSAGDLERVAARVLVPDRRIIVWVHGRAPSRGVFR